MEIKIVKTLDELAKIWELTYSEYLREGYCSPRPCNKLCHYKHLDITDNGELYPQTTVYYVEEYGEVVGTNSITLDGLGGLHVDGSFREAVDEIRLEAKEAKKVLASSWRIVTSYKLRNTISVLTELVNVVYNQIVKNNIDITLFIFHPKHAQFYERMVGLKTIAGPLSELAVTGHPAVLMRGDIEDVDIWRNTYARLKRRGRKNA